MDPLMTRLPSTPPLLLAVVAAGKDAYVMTALKFPCKK